MAPFESFVRFAKYSPFIVTVAVSFIVWTFGDKARYWSKISFFIPLAFDAPVRGVRIGILTYCFLPKN